MPNLFLKPPRGETPEPPEALPGFCHPTITEVFWCLMGFYLPVTSREVTFLLPAPLRVTPGLSGGTGPALRACGPVPKLLISTREFHSYYSPCQLPLRLPALAGHYPVFTEQQGPTKTPPRLWSKSYTHFSNRCKSSLGPDPHFVPMKDQRWKSRAPQTRSNPVYGLSRHWCKKQVFFPQKTHCESVHMAAELPEKRRGTAEATSGV